MSRHLFPLRLRQAGVRALLALSIAGLLAACGGDAGESNDPTAAPAPTVTAKPAAGSVEAVITVERAVVFPVPDRTADPLSYAYERERLPVQGQTADGVFLLVSVDAEEGWILAAQAEIAGDLSAVATVAPIEETPAPTPSATPSPAASASPAAPPTRTFTPWPTASASAAEGDLPPTPTARASRTPLPSLTPSPPGLSTDEAALVQPDAAAEIDAVATAPSIRVGAPPPLTVTLPEGWEQAHLLLPFRTTTEIRDVPLTLAEGPLPGDVQGHLYLFWGFPNVTNLSGDFNLWGDAIQLLRGSLVDQSCNIGLDLEPKTYSVGGREAIGTLFSAVDCEGEPDTAGYFAALQVEGGNYAFFLAVEPPDAFADQLPALQAILDSVEFSGAPIE